MYATATASTSVGVYSLNIEYFFRLLYGVLTHLTNGSFDFGLLFTSLWFWITILSYIVSAGLIGLLVYLSVLEFQIKETDEEKYGLITPDAAEENVESSRWRHIEALMTGLSPNDWRQAIIEADIMLDDILTAHGYPGATLGEKLKYGDPERFQSLNDAWDAHRVRNEIAHQGSQYQLSEQLANRTIAKYRNVFREFGAVM